MELIDRLTELQMKVNDLKVRNEILLEVLEEKIDMVNDLQKALAEAQVRLANG